MTQNNYRLFEKETRRLFGFLEGKYKFRITSIEKEPPNVGMHIIYMNKTTAVQVSYEPMENFVPVYLMRLIGGHLPEYPTEYASNTFYLDQLLALRAPRLRINQQPKKQWLSSNEISNILAQYARVLRMYAADVLVGDFAVFKQLKGTKREIGNQGQPLISDGTSEC